MNLTFDQIVDDTIEQRGKIYGDPKVSLKNIGLAWTAILQQHYQFTFAHAIPAEVVAHMMAVLKIQRMSLAHQNDNYVDAAAYLRFAQELQIMKENS